MPIEKSLSIYDEICKIKDFPGGPFFRDTTRTIYNGTYNGEPEYGTTGSEYTYYVLDDKNGDELIKVSKDDFNGEHSLSIKNPGFFKTIPIGSFSEHGDLAFSVFKHFEKLSALNRSRKEQLSYKEKEVFLQRIKSINFDAKLEIEFPRNIYYTQTAKFINRLPNINGSLSNKNNQISLNIDCYNGIEITVRVQGDVLQNHVSSFIDRGRFAENVFYHIVEKYSIAKYGSALNVQDFLDKSHAEEVIKISKEKAENKKINKDINNHMWPISSFRPSLPFCISDNTKENKEKRNMVDRLLEEKYGELRPILSLPEKIIWDKKQIKTR